MRIRRLLLENYRGTARREVEFLPAGVTVVQGPNEIGKTSLAEALDVLLEFHDASTDRRVKAVKPVHADVGTLIEADIDLGDHSFTYRKRFFKARETLVELSAPTRSTITGREAHDYVKALVVRHLDEALWRALRVRQGEELGQVDVSGARSLASALDRAAGVSAAGDGEVALIERARAESARYFTPSGRDGAALREADEEVAASRDEVEKFEGALQDLEDDLAECVRLERSVASLGERLAAAEERYRKTNDAWNEVLARTNALQTLRLEVDAARSRRDEVAGRSEVRRRLVQDAERMNAAITDADRALGKWLDAIARIEAGHADGARQVDDARAAAAAARALFDVRQADFEHRRDAFDLELLQERHARISAAIQDHATAAEILAGARVDEELLAELRAADLARHAAHAAFSAGAPKLRVRAESAVGFRLDDDDIHLGPTEVVERTISGATRLMLDGVDIMIEAGSSAESARAGVHESELHFECLLGAAGVADLAAAEAVFERRRDAARRTVEADRVIDENLRDLTLDEMEAKIGGLTRLVEKYAAERVEGSEPASTLEDARRRRDEAARALREAEEDLRSASEICDELASELQSLRVQERETRIGSEAAGAQLASIMQQLEAQRAEVPDDVLAEEMAKAGRELAAARAAYEAEQASLERLDPDAARELAEDAEATVGQTRAALGAEQERLRDMRASLKARGEHGLHDKLEDARSRLAHAEADRARVRRRAAAAKLLLDTLVRNRDAARRAYVAPLRDQMTRLGRVVFGDTFELDLNDDLRIATRTWRGRTVPFDSLSAGTKEQLAIIERMAASILVAGEEGVPVIFDDALGYSDESRLAAMGAVLGLAGRDCQVIVLTCYPERYGHVAGARVVSLS